MLSRACAPARRATAIRHRSGSWLRRRFSLCHLHAQPQIFSHESFDARERPIRTSYHQTRRNLGAVVTMSLMQSPVMATGVSAHVDTVQLNSVETHLRDLLLDVAHFIDSEHTSSENPAKSSSAPSDQPLELRFTGGWVRDKLLGVESHDIDVAINKMTGYAFGLRMKEYISLPGNAEKYGLDQKRSSGDLHKIEANPEKSKHLETVTTRIFGLDVDLVNLRKETYSDDSRNPQMEFGTPEEDALRRDATVNAMFFNLGSSKIEDFTGRGFKDMADKVIRTPLEPYQTFKDDPLRMLRLIRFASRLGYTIDTDAEDAMRNAEIKHALKLKISRERIGVEVEKMLRGPDPLTAITTIDRLDLYQDIFTDPVRSSNQPRPDISRLKVSYNFLSKLRHNNLFEDTGMNGSSENPQNGRDISTATDLNTILLRNQEEDYLAWVLAALMPWADAPPIVPDPSKPGKVVFQATVVAREGIKAPNKICDVVTSSLRNNEELRDLKDKYVARKRYPYRASAARENSDQDVTARDTLGMAIRRWGSSWRSQMLFAMLYEVSDESANEEDILRGYSEFLFHLKSLQLLDAYAMKPLLDGKAISKALSMKPGPWMKDALDTVMAWQLRNPDIKDSSEALQAVKDKQNGEDLSACLAHTFLALTLPPLFKQPDRPIHQQMHDLGITTSGRKVTREIPQKKISYSDSVLSDEQKKPWRSSDSWALELLEWTLNTFDREESERLGKEWPLLLPPILQVLDDTNAAWKARGCDLARLLLRVTPPALLAKTGLAGVFEEALVPCLSYLPSITPEDESIALLNAAYPALIELANARYPPPSPTTATTTNTAQNQRNPSATSTKPIINRHTRERFLSSLVRDGILTGFFHAGTHFRIATTLLTNLPLLLNELGILSVKHLQELVPLISRILADPMSTAYIPLLTAAARAMRSVVLNAWPRVGVYRAELLRGVCVLWVRLAKEGTTGEEVRELKRDLRQVVETLVPTLEGEVDWRAEFKELMAADDGLKELLDVDELRRDGEGARAE